MKDTCYDQIEDFKHTENNIINKNQIINELANSKKQDRNILDTRYDRITELKHIKNNIIKWNKLIN